ncbi:DUF6653 family protein [Halobacterium wangiae]|uniref:DUF6653 family protein n=1 Tax=Halobacterium wangiae TaxID=2902623 RepID=UPI001E5463F0|nr:DUF6653 family protein [Halobacterium wangiae]
MPSLPRRLSSFADRYFWRGHANPGSVWTFVAAYPVFVLAVYRRDLRLLGAVLAFVAVNPVVFPEPADDSAWATRVVLGERAWLADGLLSSPLDLLLVVAVAPFHLWTLHAAVRRRPVRAAVGTALALPLMGLFFGRMARLYDER